jgi:hypothetical protein
MNGWAGNFGHQFGGGDLARSGAGFEKLATKVPLAARGTDSPADCPYLRKV